MKLRGLHVYFFVTKSIFYLEIPCSFIFMRSERLSILHPYIHTDTWYEVLLLKLHVRHSFFTRQDSQRAITLGLTHFHACLRFPIELNYVTSSRNNLQQPTRV